MASFTTRVELHNATWDDYVKLHEKMRGQGFSQTIASSDGAIYQLPPAEYDYSGNLTREQVRDKAHAAVSTVKPNPGILVTEANGRCWIGLTKISAKVA